MRGGRSRVGVLLAAALLLLTACGGGSPDADPAPGAGVVGEAGEAGAPAAPTPVAKVPQLDVLAATGTTSTMSLPGGRALVLRPTHPDGRLVMYFHGAGEGLTGVQTDPKKAPIIAGLLRRGYTVAAGTAFGNAWGSTASLRDYRQLQRRVARTLPPGRGTYVLAESMGGLDGLRAPDVLPDVRAVAAIFPLCDLDSMMAGSLADEITASFRERLPTALQRLSPALARRVRELPVHVWASPDDNVVPYAANAEACTRLARARGARVTLTPTVGAHGDLSNFHPAQVVSLFGAASREPFWPAQRARQR